MNRVQNDFQENVEGCKVQDFEEYSSIFFNAVNIVDKEFYIPEHLLQTSALSYLFPFQVLASIPLDLFPHLCRFNAYPVQS